MKRMRIKSSKLAALLLLFTLPLASIPAFAANTQKPELVFVQGDNGDPTTATIITGQSIAIKETIPQGYVAQGITVTQKGDDQPIASGFDIPTPHQSITVSETFNPGNRHQRQCGRDPLGREHLRSAGQLLRPVGGRQCI